MREPERRSQRQPLRMNLDVPAQAVNVAAFTTRRRSGATRTLTDAGQPIHAEPVPRSR